MFELSDASEQVPPSRVDVLLQRICGHPREYPVHHQVLNWVFFFWIFLMAVGGIENVLLGIPMTWPMFVSSGMLAFFYYLTRIKRKWVVPLAILSVLIWYAVLFYGWFANAGLVGSSVVWFMGMVVIVTVFRRQSIRALVIGFFLLEFAVLAGIQMANPSLVPPYPTPLVGYIDITFGVAVVSFYIIGGVLILSYNLEQRQHQAEELLLNLLPRHIAEQLEYSRNRNVAEYVPNASVLFADVKDFTPMTADMAASDLIELLNEVFSAFDRLVEQRGLEKIKTIGDCYMVGAGVPESRDDHACILADLALAMQRYVSGRVFKGKKLSFRIGINSGPLVAGVIGRKKFIYDLWGDTVNTASRMESHGVAGCIQVTEATRALIEGEFCCEPRGTIPVKGKGDMPVWFVTGRKSPQLAVT